MEKLNLPTHWYIQSNLDTYQYIYEFLNKNKYSSEKDDYNYKSWNTDINSDKYNKGDIEAVIFYPSIDKYNQGANKDGKIIPPGPAGWWSLSGELKQLDYYVDLKTKAIVINDVPYFEITIEDLVPELKFKNPNPNLLKLLHEYEVK